MIGFILQLGLVMAVWLGLYTALQVLLRVFSLEVTSLVGVRRESFRHRLYPKSPHGLFLLCFVFFNIILSPLLMFSLKPASIENSKQAINIENGAILRDLFFPLIVFQLVVLGCYLVLVRSIYSDKVQSENEYH